MLALGNAREGNLFVAIIEHRRALEVALRAEYLEIERAIAESLSLKPKKRSIGPL